MYNYSRFSSFSHIPLVWVRGFFFGRECVYVCACSMHCVRWVEWTLQLFLHILALYVWFDYMIFLCSSVVLSLSSPAIDIFFLPGSTRYMCCNGWLQILLNTLKKPDSPALRWLLLPFFPFFFYSALRRVLSFFFLQGFLFRWFFCWSIKIPYDENITKRDDYTCSLVCTSACLIQASFLPHDVMLEP